MEKFILQPTSMAQWHALIEEARLSTSIRLTEDLESYLIFLLMRFTKEPCINQNILAIDFLENSHGTKKENRQILRDVGDKCLLFSGLFPGQASRRRVQVSYYVKLGQSAYSSLSLVHQNELSVLFGNLCQHFVELMDILRTVRDLDSHAHSNHSDLLEAEQLWNDTQSQHAFKLLRKTTQGFFIPRTPENPQQKH